MKKLFLIFTVLFTCALPVSGFGDIVTNNRNTFNNLTQEFSNTFTQFQTESQDKMQQLRREQQEKMEKVRREQQEKMEKMRREQQEKMDQLKQQYNAKLNELKEKAPEAFRDIELSFNEYIRNTPFENCDLGYSSIKCYKDNNKTYSAWACTLKPGITKEKMNQDVQKHCSTTRQELEFKPDIPETTDTDSTETDNESVRLTAQVEELSPENEVTAHAEHNANADFDFMAAQKQEQETKDWNTNYNVSDETPASTPAPTPNKSASAMIAQDATRKAEKNKKTCTPAQRNKINATNCKISPDGKYSDIVCKNGFELKDGKCIKKSDTPDKTKKSAKPELINITATVVIKGTDTPIGGVDIKYDEGKKDKEGNIKYGKHRTDNSGLFAIDIVPNSTVTFTHKMYKDTNETFSATIKKSDNKKINMTPTEATTENTQLQTLCEKDKKGTWNKTSGKCNCKGKNTTFDKTKGCIEPENLQRGGNVIDEKGNPMPNVTIKYGNKKIQTDKDGRFDITAPKGTTITFTAKGYKDIKETLDEARPNWDIDMEPTDKAANNAEKQKLCEKDGKGEWKPKLNKCNCKDKKAFFDETDGCTTATTEYTNAEDALKTLYEQFNTQLEIIKNQNTPQ